MFWPSIMSLAPPPVTPRRKLPPRLGVPDVAVEDEEPQAASTLPSARAPASSSRRDVVGRCHSQGPRLDLSSILFPPAEVALYVPSCPAFKPRSPLNAPTVVRPVAGRLWGMRS